MPLMTITEYARHRGVSQPAVSKAIAAHRIKKERSGKIDSDKADVSWALKTDPVRSLNNAHGHSPAVPLRSDPPRGGSGVPTPHDPEPALGFSEKVALRIAMQRLRKETAQADTAEIERDKLKDSLLSRAVVDEHIASFSQMVRDHMMAQPDRLAATLAAVDDIATVHRILKTDIDAALRKLSKAVASAAL
jgi:hypothetical protein